MKQKLLIIMGFIALGFLMVNCTVKAEGTRLPVGDNQGRTTRDKPDRTRPAPSQEVMATYISECQKSGDASYRLTVNIVNNKPVGKQITYMANSSCVGVPGSSDVVATAVVDGLSAVPVDATHLLVEKKNSGVAPIRVTLVDAREFANEVGSFVYYTGVVKGATESKTVTEFAQIVALSRDQFPYVWTQENGVEKNPRSNPWVWSGARTSDAFKDLLGRCAKSEDVVVAAGRFKACLVEKDGVKIWYGNVGLYGIVKYEKPAGTEGGYYYFNELERSAGLPKTSAVTLELAAHY